MTKDQAIALYESKFWEGMSHKERAMFQLFEDRLCMPFEIFHEAIEKSLSRPVFTHEFGLNREGIKRELLGKDSAPSMGQIMGLIPEEKRIVIFAGTAQ